MFEASEVVGSEATTPVNSVGAPARPFFVQCTALRASALAVRQGCASIVGGRTAVGRLAGVPSLHGSRHRIVRASVDARARYGPSAFLARESQSSAWSRRSQPNQAFEPTPMCNATFGARRRSGTECCAAFGVQPHRGAAQQRR
jgi:hypothetical protein